MSSLNGNGQGPKRESYMVTGKEFNELTDHVSFIRSVERIIDSANSALEGYYNSEEGKQYILDDRNNEPKPLSDARMNLVNQYVKGYFDSSHYLMAMMMGRDAEEYYLKRSAEIIEDESMDILDKEVAMLEQVLEFKKGLQHIKKTRID